MSKNMIIRACALALAGGLVAGACARGADPADLRAAWRWRPPRTASVGMPSADGLNAAATYGHLRLVLLDGKGRLQWQAERLGLRDVAPLLLADSVVTATDTGVAAFDRRTGRRQWDVDLGDRANTPVAVAGRLAVTTWDGRLLLLDRADGSVLHAVTLPGAVLGPAAAGDRTAVTSWDDGLEAGVTAVDAVTGAARWQVEVAADGVSSPAVVAGAAVVVTGDARVLALDLASGAVRWTRRTDGAGSPEVPPFVGRDLVVADRLGGLAGLGPTDGRSRWRVSGRGAAVRGGPVVAGPVTALPIDDGRVLVRQSGGVGVIDPPGRVSGVAAGPGPTLLVATREAEQNELIAYRFG
jgi:outer membrane protein assembly factor BamB